MAKVLLMDLFSSWAHFLTSQCSHGKDNKLIVWAFAEEDEPSMSVSLPVDTPPEPRRQPWMLFLLHVNTMNFCSFAQASLSSSTPLEGEPKKELLLAVPNTISSETVYLPLYLSHKI